MLQRLPDRENVDVLKLLKEEVLAEIEWVHFISQAQQGDDAYRFTTERAEYGYAEITDEDTDSTTVERWEAWEDREYHPSRGGHAKDPRLFRYFFMESPTEDGVVSYNISLRTGEIRGWEHNEDPRNRQAIASPREGFLEALQTMFELTLKND